MKGSQQFADIILPFPINQLFTYSIPENLIDAVCPGIRVIVQFGPRKLSTGIVCRTHSKSPEIKEIKPILEVLDDHPIVTEIQLKFWEWMADYYMCAPGEVFKAALPSGLKLESESNLLPNDDFAAEDFGKEQLETLFYIVKNNPGLSIQELSKKAGRSGIHNDIRKLIDSEAIYIEEKLVDTSRVKKEKIISLSENLISESEMQKCLDSLKSAPKQEALLTEIIGLSLDSKGNLTKKNIPLSDLTAKHSAAAIKTLSDKGIIIKSIQTISSIGKFSGEVVLASELNPGQKVAYNSINQNFKEKEVVLLHGVTSSGKTEIYIHLIQDAISRGKQVLYLLPEIALTSQIVNRLRKVFGDQVGTYHSKFSDSERLEVYKRTSSSKENGFKIILGVRSAIFLPFNNLGLIIVDEEHENTFKQFDPAPRYNARDSSMILAGLHGAKVLLGTATPSVETYANALAGKFGLVQLTERYNEVLMPDIRIADIKEARKRKTMISVFTPSLIDAIYSTIASGKQVILFQNRRGFASYLMDENCGWIPKCKICDVSLTYHKFRNSLECHYCGYSTKVPGSCETCGSTRLTNKGFGTEMIEDEIGLIFKGIRVARLDLDTSRTRNSYETILESFGRGEIDVLVGTQMLSKGLDFENVALVGILDADQMLNFPDFRAFERSYQLMAQVSGRAGRKDKQGTVIIQTTDPKLALINYVKANDYESMFKEQIEERQIFNYPPFVRMIRITLKHKELPVLQKAANVLADEMKIVFGKRVLGPQQPLVGRISNYYLLNILLKVEKKASFGRARKLVSDIIKEATNSDVMNGVRILPDVDPY